LNKFLSSFLLLGFTKSGFDSVPTSFTNSMGARSGTTLSPNTGLEHYRMYRVYPFCGKSCPTAGSACSPDGTVGWSIKPAAVHEPPGAPRGHAPPCERSCEPWKGAKPSCFQITLTIKCY
jgi:hypothetical protein